MFRVEPVTHEFRISVLVQTPEYLDMINFCIKSSITDLVKRMSFLVRGVVRLIDRVGLLRVDDLEGQPDSGNEKAVSERHQFFKEILVRLHYLRRIGVDIQFQFSG